MKKARTPFFLESLPLLVGWGQPNKYLQGNEIAKVELSSYGVTPKVTPFKSTPKQ
jgi:hypothetical protein